IIVGFALVDAVLRRGAFAAEHNRWWKTVVPACVVAWLACLVNPYGLRGAIYPLELAGTMRNPIFSKSIAELTPIPLFIKQTGLSNVPMQLHLVTMALGALSFLIPLTWLAWVRLRGPAALPQRGDELAAGSRSDGSERGSRQSAGSRKSGKQAGAARRKRAG